MISNIEPIAREITRGICRDNQMQETQIDQWVDLHWQCAAAMLEAGVMDETGEWIEGKDLRRGLEAYRADVATGSSAPSASPEDRAERRQVTVMFSDLVGSTALSARMDPEDFREVISGYQNSVAETVGRFGGFVAKYMGDGVLIYFGYPHAHEDDAERAVRAGLQLVTAIGDLKTHAALQTRVGIATGVVVVGDLIGSGPLRSSQSSAIHRTSLRACRVLRRRTAW